MFEKNEIYQYSVWFIYCVDVSYIIMNQIRILISFPLGVSAKDNDQIVKQIFQISPSFLKTNP